MTQLQQLLEACKTSYIVRAEWTVNGKPSGNRPPQDWTHMRVKLKDKKEFLLSAEDVALIGKKWISLWEKKNK